MKVLCMYASAGAGHMKAAEAVYESLKKNNTHDVRYVDALDYATPWFKHLYAGTYTFLISKVPALWGFFFWVADIRVLQPAIRLIRRLQNFCHTGALRRLLIEEDFDYIISTHFMPTEVAAALKRSGRIRSRLICCITDYDVHRIWLMPEVNFYCVATEWTLGKLAQLGVPAQKVIVSGIPVSEKFTQSFDIQELKDKLGLKRDVFTVLIATGSFGIGPIEAIIEQLTGFQIIVICGHNRVLYNRLKAADYPLLHVCGFVENMDELMAASDAIVTKPGGLSITEAMVQQLPLVFFNAIPGQEIHNVRVLSEYGIGVSGLNLAGIAEELNKMKSSRDYHMTVLKKTKTLARPDAVKTITALIQ